MKKYLFSLIFFTALFACKSEKTKVVEPTLQEIVSYEAKIDSMMDSVAIKASKVEAELDQLLNEL